MSIYATTELNKGRNRPKISKPTFELHLHQDMSKEFKKGVNNLLTPEEKAKFDEYTKGR